MKVIALLIPAVVCSRACCASTGELDTRRCVGLRCGELAIISSSASTSCTCSALPAGSLQLSESTTSGSNTAPLRVRFAHPKSTLKTSGVWCLLRSAKPSSPATAPRAHDQAERHEQCLDDAKPSNLYWLRCGASLHRLGTSLGVESSKKEEGEAKAARWEAPRRANKVKRPDTEWRATRTRGV